MLKNLLKTVYPFSLYWYFILDTILTHFYAIFFLYNNHPALSAVVMSIDAALRILLSVFIAKKVVPLSANIRGYISVVLRVAMIFVWLVAIKLGLLKADLIYLLSFFLIFKLMMLVTSSVGLEFVFSLRKIFSIDLSQSNAAQNIILRASTAVAPAIALILLNDSGCYIIFSFIFILSVVAMYLLRDIFFATNTSVFQPVKEMPMPFFQILKNPLMRWGLFYQLLANLAFAGVAFLLLTYLKPQGSTILNEITVLYASFFVVQCLALIWGEAIVPAQKKWQLAMMLGLCGVCVFLVGYGQGAIFRLEMCALIGVVYSFSISGLQKVVTSALHGKGFLEYSSWAQTVGRVSSYTSTMLLGLAMSQGWGSDNLLMLCGVVGVVGMILLMFDLL